jgi:hypothetical protein
MTTTYTKLKDGSWRLHTTATVREGDSVTVTKKDGGTKRETVARVLWGGNGVSLCSLAFPRRGRSERERRCSSTTQQTSARTWTALATLAAE